MLLGAAAAAAACAAAVPAQMRAVRVKGLIGCGAPWDCVTVETVATPAPRKGQILIRSGGSSVNPVDVGEERMGSLKGTLGADVAGTVAAVGGGVTKFKVGDRVWADAISSGAYADYVIATELQTGFAPSTLSLAEAGTVPLVGFTAAQMLQQAGAPWTSPNVSVVVTSGTGGTGYIGVQLAKALGAAHVATSATGDGVAFAKSLGADTVVDYKVQEVLASLPDDSVDVVMDNYGAKGAADVAMKKLRAGGTYVLLPGGEGGSLSKNPKPGVKQVNFGLTKSDDASDGLDLLQGLFEKGAMKVHVGAQYSFDEVAKAFAASGGVLGKVSVVPNATLH